MYKTGDVSEVICPHLEEICRRTSHHRQNGHHHRCLQMEGKREPENHLVRQRGIHPDDLERRDLFFKALFTPPPLSLYLSLSIYTWLKKQSTNSHKNHVKNKKCWHKLANFMYIYIYIYIYMFICICVYIHSMCVCDS